MSYVQKNAKFLKDKQKNLEFFESYLDISKLRILQVLNEEQKALDSLRLVKYSNTKLLDTINKNFFKNEKTFIEERDVNRKNKEELYFLVDAKENNQYSETIYKKLEETLEARIKNGDSVVTIGKRVHLIAQRLELNIIEHFPYDLYENESAFINKIATIIEVGFKNGVFTDSTLIIAQQNQENRELVMKKLAPFVDEKISESEIFASETQTITFNNQQATRTSDFSLIRQNASIDYSKFCNNIDIKKLSWIPNITFFKFKLVKAIIKQSTVELRMIEKIQRLRLEIQLLDEKRNKIHDELIVVNRLANRLRREKETESTIVLYSAFKVRNSGVDILDENIRKKREDDELLYKKYKGGRT